MGRLLVVLGTDHVLQGAAKRFGNVDDPLYEVLLRQVISEHSLDFIFEEITGMGPTTAENLSRTLLGPDRYLDVDPPHDTTNEPIHLGSPFASTGAKCANKVFDKVHAKREQAWLEQIVKQEFKKALIICGQNHTLSFTSRLRAANFDVNAITYGNEPPVRM